MSAPRRVRIPLRDARIYSGATDGAAVPEPGGKARAATGIRRGLGGSEGLRDPREGLRPTEHRGEAAPGSAERSAGVGEDRAASRDVPLTSSPWPNCSPRATKCSTRMKPSASSSQTSKTSLSFRRNRSRPAGSIAAVSWRPAARPQQPSSPSAGA